MSVIFTYFTVSLLFRSPYFPWCFESSQQSWQR